MSRNAERALIDAADQRADQRETAQREWREWSVLPPITPPMGLVERLRNGGQGDLADMAQEMLNALLCANNVLFLLAPEVERLGCGAEYVPGIVSAAINTANGAQA